MTVFIDGHDLKNLTKQQLQKLVNSPPDKFGITHKQVLFNEKKDKLYCILEGPDQDAVHKHHQSVGINCEFITDVEEIQRNILQKSEQLAVIGELSDRITHDLRNPLTVIKTITQIIRKRDPNLTRDTLEDLKIIDDVILKLTHQIHDVLDFVKVRPLNLANHSLMNIINKTVSSIMIPDSVDLVLPKNNISIICDSEKIASVLTNLIINGIQAINYKGSIKINTLENNDFVDIEIEDSGPGIPDDVLPKIFDPLFTTRQTGTGLGLVSCKNIIEQHKGFITVSNNPTKFIVKLPKQLQV